MTEEISIETQSTKLKRSDITAMWVGIVFSLLFTGLIWWLGPRLDKIALLPDQGASWYYWKLPDPTVLSRVTAWGFYLLHQFSIWGLIYYAQRRVKKYSTTLHRVNYIALGANAFFILLHMLQTHLWYDGLAQDVSIWSSQASVVFLLVWVLLMENRRRGMFFGKSLPISKQIIRFARKYHGYFFSWATIYTFWYHPTVSTSGHLLGFLYMFLLLLQGSLFFTRIHVNRYWTLAQEVGVLIHGTIVAVMQGNGLWPMFAFGFGGVFVITQMHGLGLSKWVRWALLGGYIGAALIIYSERGWAMLNEIIRIPLIDYLAVLILAGLIGAGLWIAGKFRRSPLESQVS
ncbi:MAG: hypothetical protein MUO76_09225 [Anaerolineaceae bacterium]|nr:hypothetical protein [Anaerolineaceae bacterium]